MKPLICNGVTIDDYAIKHASEEELNKMMNIIDSKTPSEDEEHIYFHYHKLIMDRFRKLERG